MDLGEEIKDYILLEMPLNPLCKSSCEGLCLNLRGKPQPHAVQLHVDSNRPPLGSP